MHQKRQECSIEWCAVIVNSTLSFYIFILNLYFGNKDYIHVVIVNSTLSSKDWIFMAKYNLTNLQFEWHKYKFDSPLSFHKRQIPQKRDFLHIDWFFTSCVTCSLNQQVFLFRGKVLTGLLQSDSLSSWAQSHCFIVKYEEMRQMCVRMVWWSYILCGLNQQPAWLSDLK